MMRGARRLQSVSPTTPDNTYPGDHWVRQPRSDGGALGPSRRRALRRCLQRYPASVRRGPALWRLLACVYYRHSTGTYDRPHCCRAGHVRATLQILRPIPVTAWLPLAMILFGMINWTFTWLRPDGKLTYDDMARIVSEIFLAGVLPGASPVSRRTDTARRATARIANGKILGSAR